MNEFERLGILTEGMDHNFVSTALRSQGQLLLPPRERETPEPETD